MTFWFAIVLWTMISLIYAIQFIYHGADIWFYLRYFLYSATLSAGIYSAHKDWHFKTVCTGCMIILYALAWGITISDAMSGNGTILHFPAVLFGPIFLVLVTGFRLLLIYAAAQGSLIFYYSRTFAAEIYGIDLGRVDSTEFAIIFGLLSSFTLVLLSVVSYVREKTDHKVLTLIAETERLATEDPLTGLMNRRAFIKQLDELWTIKAAFSVAFIDLDRFKPLNDQYGHAIGDLVLQEVGTRLKTASNVMAAARLGGDEFAVIIADPSVARIQTMHVEELHQLITANIDVGVASVSVGASIGVARAVLDGANIGEVLHAADTAMMRCKANGGGVAQFDPAQDDISLSASAISEAFRYALNNGQIKAALQPVVDAKSQKIVGHELLARWEGSGLSRDPSPLEFIPIAEKLGLLNQLLWTTLRTALPVIKAGDGFLAINASPSQLSSDTFLDDLTAITATFGVSLDRIEIEVTEHVAFRNLDDNVRVLQQARAKGCRIALDDFGTGYSSLSLLEELPLDKLKIDKSLQTRKNKRGVLEATIRLATELGFECCIEGIETEHAANIARQLGCTQMQGYLFGHPEIIDPNIHKLKVAS